MKMVKCKYRKKCHYYDIDSNVCNSTGGKYYGDSFAGCYIKIETKIIEEKNIRKIFHVPRKLGELIERKIDKILYGWRINQNGRLKMPRKDKTGPPSGSGGARDGRGGGRGRAGGKWVRSKKGGKQGDC